MKVIYTIIAVIAFTAIVQATEYTEFTICDTISQKAYPDIFNATLDAGEGRIVVPGGAYMGMVTESGISKSLGSVTVGYIIPGKMITVVVFPVDGSTPTNITMQGTTDGKFTVYQEV